MKSFPAPELAELPRDPPEPEASVNGAKAVNAATTRKPTLTLIIGEADTIIVSL